jgi:hypothetical protein
MNPYRFESRMEPMTRQETSAWSEIEHSFRTAKAIGPRKGFANRWMHVQRQHQLIERKQREFWLALGNGTAIFAILGVIALTIWPIFQPTSIFTSLLESLLDTLTFVGVLAAAIISFLETFSLLIWFGAALGFFSLIAVWVSLFSRVAVGNR